MILECSLGKPSINSRQHYVDLQSDRLPADILRQAERNQHGQYPHGTTLLVSSRVSFILTKLGGNCSGKMSPIQITNRRQSNQHDPTRFKPRECMILIPTPRDYFRQFSTSGMQRKHQNEKEMMTSYLRHKLSFLFRDRAERVFTQIPTLLTPHI